ncbi:MAG: pyridoxamine 5'-phosphate oxidase family protein [Chitinophagaceae bacterium]|nr:pyridoxamine 5'-phosphate oxidase family protein [Chitinophagaceae bacterium]
MLGQLDENHIEKVLHKQVLGRIGCHANGVTYIVPVCYAYDGNCIYARSNDGLKIDLMRKNPKVCFEVENIKDLANWKTVILWGDFEEITGAEERKAALDILLNRHMPIVSGEMARLTPNWPFQPDNLNEVSGVLYKIKIEKKTGRFENYQGIDEVSQSYL